MIIPIAQTVDIYPGDGKPEFARTGELSLFHIKNAGAKGTLLGHSEVGESPEIINKKLQAAWQAGLLLNIVLVGERWEDLGKPWEALTQEEQQGVSKKVKEKLTRILVGVSKETVLHTVFAYEPAWSITGSGKSDVPPASADQITQVAATMRATFEELYDKEVALRTRLIYGGSMDKSRAPEIMALPNMDGFIIGSAGTKTESVKHIVDAVIQNKKKRMPLLALNWKAYKLEEPSEAFIDTLKPFALDCDICIAPAATELLTIARLIQ